MSAFDNIALIRLFFWVSEFLLITLIYLRLRFWMQNKRCFYLSNLNTSASVWFTEELYVPFGHREDHKYILKVQNNLQSWWMKLSWHQGGSEKKIKLIWRCRQK